MLTLSKIAKLANVSVSTASKAFSMSPEVNEETREQIFEIAKKHGCFKKFFNAKYPRLVVAAICPELDSLYYATIMARLQSTLEKRGCELCVATTQFSKSRASSLVNYYSKYARVDGIILLDCASAIESASDIPVVCTGRASERAVRVIIDHKAAIEDAIDHFISAGITDIGFIGEWLTESKKNSFINTVTKRLGSYNPDYISVGDRFADGAYRSTEKLIDSGHLPRALLCAYDYLAIGAIRCLADRGYKVPEDVAIIGMDDIPVAKYLTPSLSSIDHNCDGLCEAVADTLINMMMGKEYRECTVIDSTLHLRESSRIGVKDD